MHTVLKSAALVLSPSALALVAIGSAASAQPAPPPWQPSPSITASLDIGGSGNFTGVFDNGQLCYLLNAAGVGQATAAAIHSGKDGATGPAVVQLAVPVNGASGACQPVDPKLARDLVKNAPGYYLEIDTTTYPQGAVRAQLSGANG